MGYVPLCLLWEYLNFPGGQKMSDHQAGAGPQQPPQTLNVAGQTVRLQQVLAAAGSRGQQFVITSQVSVPGLTQVMWFNRC